MMTYTDGVEIKTGDRITFDGEPSVIEDIIDSEEKMAEWGLQESGVMITNTSMGLVFESFDLDYWNTIEFVERGGLE